MKKVIFVGGTSYSGSTFFDMTLGNDPAGFSIGEAYAYFYPFRSHHLRPVCSCGDTDCGFWSSMRSVDPRNLYGEIFRRLPHIDFIVDSSKHPLWIRQASRNLAEQGVETRNILIWKDPAEIALSFEKRGRFHHWQRSWVNYHRLYNTVVRDWVAIRYRSYVDDTASLGRVCDFLGIRHFPDKHRYWQKTHHLLFGNDSARIHLDRDGKALQDDSSRSQAMPGYVHQHVRYDPGSNANLIDEVQRVVAASAEIRSLMDLLIDRDVGGQTRPSTESMSWTNMASTTLRVSGPELTLRLAIWQARRAVRYLRTSAA
jgi:hypothetical protein